MATVLIGFGEAIAAPEVAWSLIDAGHRVVAFVRRGKASGLRHSRRVSCREIRRPETDLKGALSDLQALEALLEQDSSGERILFPLDDTALWLCSRAEVRDGWRLAGPRACCAELALNKAYQAEMARAAGFRVPETRIVRTIEEAFECGRSQPLPIILKPLECVRADADRVYKGKIWICANSDELQAAITEWNARFPLITQPFIDGTGEGLFGLVAPDGVCAWSAHRRLRMMNPQGSGSSACVSQAVDPDLQSKAECLLRTAGWQGLFMIELLRDRSGAVWFIELNGRPWGSMALSRRQGLEYPSWQAEVALGKQPRLEPQLTSSPGMVCRNVGRELMHLLFVLRGPKSSALKNWPSFRQALCGVAGVHRTDSLYNWRRDDPKVFMADVYYTLRDNLLKSRS